MLRRHPWVRLLRGRQGGVPWRLNAASSGQRRGPDRAFSAAQGGARRTGRERGDTETPQDVRFIADEEVGRGPLGGIATALAASERPWVFVAACDMPFLDAPVIARLWEHVKRNPDALAVALCHHNALRHETGRGSLHARGA